MITGLSEKLRALRLQNNLTQKDVANRLGISASVVSSYETFERSPSLETLLALSSLYHCSTDYLLGKETTPPKMVIEVDGLDERQIRALRLLVESIKKEN